MLLRVNGLEKGCDMSIAYGNFNLTNEFNLLRIVCGALFIPHILICGAFFFPRTFSKFFVPDALEIFIKAGFKPPVTWMAIAGAIEIVLAVGLIFAIYTSYSAAAASVYLCIVSAAIYRVSGRKWFWNTGGCEYPVFWAFCCFLVAIHG